VKVVINKCFGGFGLSSAGIRRLAELKGRKCFFFKHDLRTRKFEPASGTEESIFVTAFDIPNPGDVLLRAKEWRDMSQSEREASNALYAKHNLDCRPEVRHDPDLVRVVEELGERASGRYASLKVVEIPDGTEYEISEYDGHEHIAEKHNTWS
jgi:hypothetical protein